MKLDPSALTETAVKPVPSVAKLTCAAALRAFGKSLPNVPKVLFPQVKTSPVVVRTAALELPAVTLCKVNPAKGVMRASIGSKLSMSVGDDTPVPNTPPTLLPQLCSVLSDVTANADELPIAIAVTDFPAKLPPTSTGALRGFLSPAPN